MTAAVGQVNFAAVDSYSCSRAYLTRKTAQAISKHAVPIPTKVLIASPPARV